MQLDGLKPNQGANPAERLKGTSRPEPGTGSAGAKSFGDAFAKAKSAGRPEAPATPAPASASASEQAPPSADTHIDTIRFRLQTGYYNNPKIDDALSDKLSGYFDDVA